MPSSPCHCVLVAVCGTSPAVITETVQGIYQKYPQFVINEVIVLTTTIGRDKILHEILENGTWNKLRQELNAPENTLRFGDCSDSIRLIPSLDKKRNLADISTPEDHLSMADQLCSILRSYTDNPNITLLASLAGGRKTMSTMMGLCFSLFARDHDKLFHVLVNEPFDSRLTPPFHFKPATPVEHTTANGLAISSEQANIDLIEIPCVRLRKLFPLHFNQAPGSYSDLVRQANEVAEQCHNQKIRFNWFEGECLIGDKCIIERKAPLQFWLYFAIAHITVHRKEIKTSAKLSEYLSDLQKYILDSKPNVYHRLHDDFDFSPLDISKALTIINKKLDSQYALYAVKFRHSRRYILEVDANLIDLDSEHVLRNVQL